MTTVLRDIAVFAIPVVGCTAFAWWQVRKVTRQLDAISIERARLDADE